jgi:hypothetical protein
VQPTERTDRDELEDRNQWYAANTQLFMVVECQIQSTDLNNAEFSTCRLPRKRGSVGGGGDAQQTLVPVHSWPLISS